MTVIWHGLRDSFLMAWEVGWALVLGFAISAIVQAWVPQQRIRGLLAGSGPRPIGWAALLGAGSSSCSYAAVAISKTLFQKGASAASALAFQVASTNLVWELGLVLWALIGWRFTLAEFAGGFLMVILIAIMLRLFVSREAEQRARERAVQIEAGHQHHAAGNELSWRRRLSSADAWSDVAHNFRGDWQMLHREILVGFVLAGFVAQFGNGFFEHLFVRNAPAPLPAVENVLVGPVIAILSFVCSVGNVPLAAVLWSGGISFAGVLAFLFADLIVLPILAIYRKYYGMSYAARISALLLLTMTVAALIVAGIFSATGLAPSGLRPTRGELFAPIRLDYTLVLNVLAAIVFASLFGLTMRQGATDPVCGMTVDRRKARRLEIDGGSYFFCGDGCLRTFAARGSGGRGGETADSAGHGHVSAHR